MKSVLIVAFVLTLLPPVGICQNTTHDFPQKLAFARHTFMDFGPPFDYYEVLEVTDDGNQTHVERLLITPPGDKCLQSPEIEVTQAIIHEPIKSLLNEKDPCSIPKKSLNKEIKRCKHCSSFSGENITLSLTCGANKRTIRMNILDKDLFDPSPNTPQHTSWTMDVLAKLDKALGSGVWNRQVFPANSEHSVSTLDNSPFIQKLKDGQFDDLFNSEKKMSEYYLDGRTYRYPPQVEIISATSTPPNDIALPAYPPIAKAAHVEGDVIVHFAIAPMGEVTEVSLIQGSKLFEGSIKETLNTWVLSTASGLKQGEATFRFRLNCGHT